MWLYVVVVIYIYVAIDVAGSEGHLIGVVVKEHLVIIVVVVVAIVFVALHLNGVVVNEC